MKKCFLFVLSVALACVLTATGSWAQESTSKDEFTLEEITVTAEKRSENLQQLPSSVVALPGNNLATQSKITTRQILENVPNVTFRTSSDVNPDGNIAIRGIQRTQDNSGNNDVLPAATAIYVDGIYEGIGGHYDVNRVEVLRGPQGTLYGRSATGGVISFYTNDPKLNEFSGNLSFEVGNYNLLNAEDVINIPIGDKVAIRAAGHYYSRDGYFDKEGQQTQTKEARIKALFQPTDPLKIVLSGSIQKTVDWVGGSVPVVNDKVPGEVIASVTPMSPTADGPKIYKQLGLNVNYDFDSSTLTWIAGYHNFDYSGNGVVQVWGNPHDGLYSYFPDKYPTDWSHTEELRLASNTDKALSWLVGANYFKHEFDSHQGGVQIGAANVPYNEVEWSRRFYSGNIQNYGLFTEETYKITDDFRVTAGLRYDKTKLYNEMLFEENVNYFDINVNQARTYPADWAGGILPEDQRKQDFDNITYKLRFEYNLTPDNMIYFVTATGFLPGSVATGPQFGPGHVLTGFDVRVLDEQKLTNYELGTKNQFLNNTLRVNGAIFYYDESGYPQAYNLSDGMPPNFAIVTVPVEVYGAEAQVEWLLTMSDKLDLSAGYLHTKITGSDPATVTWSIGGQDVVSSGADAAYLGEMPAYPKFQATAAYEHTFTLANGSTLVPRVEVIYKGEYYLDQLAKWQVDQGLEAWDKQDAFALCNANLAWTSADQNYSVNLWIRNAFDEDYLNSLQLANATYMADVGDPRTFGVSMSVKF